MYMYGQPNNTALSDGLAQLSILQQNVTKSLIAQGDFLPWIDPGTYDIGAIQEPYMDHNHNSQAGHHWYTIYPKEHYINPVKMRSLMLINRQIATDAWSQVDFSSLDIIAIQLHTERGKILKVNIYNNNVWQTGIKHTIWVTKDKVHSSDSIGHPTHMVWVGDFNLHHPCWDENQNIDLFMRMNLDKAQVLIDTIAKLDLQMALPRGIPML